MTSPGTEAIGWSLPSTETSISRPAMPCSMRIFWSNSAAWSMAGASSPSFRTLLMPTEEPRFAGLTKTGRGNAPGTSAHAPPPLAPPHRDERRRRQPGLQEQPLLHLFVHPQRRAEHARAHVGQVGQLEQSLHGAVFAEGAVQDGENDVERERQGRAFVAGADGLEGGGGGLGGGDDSGAA